MTVFDHVRLTNRTIKLDVEGLRSGFYADKYFENVVNLLSALDAAGYRYNGNSPRPLPANTAQVDTASIAVEAQYFNRRAPYALAAGVDAALAMVRYGAGYYDRDAFVETWDQLEIEAVEDGVLTHYAGDPMQVQPVLKIRGCYRHFALLETAMLGVMTRATRVATNVYNLLQVCNGKPVLFFPARFDMPEVQMIDGYAYWLAVQRYNHESGHNIPPIASTDAQSAWWGGRGGGTVPHALIACFLGDTAEAMVAYARYLPVEIPRIALVDFNNDSVGASLAVASAFWPHYRAACEAGDAEGQKCWTLAGVRLDTSKNVRDVSLEPSGDYGVNAQLVRMVREALDNAWQSWNVPASLEDTARQFCRNIQIAVSGGLNHERIVEYEAAGVPIDVYGIGSHFFSNDSDTNSDYTMDVVRVRLDGEWVNMAKTGRQPNRHPDLRPVDLREVE